MMYSHPNKPLEVHIKGVLKKYERNSSLPFGRLAVLFHDLGKLNPNFQKKILGQSTDGYTHHSYLSVIAFYSFILKNKTAFCNYLHITDDIELKVKIWQIISIIAHHHGNLPDLSAILSKDEVEIAGKFVNENAVEVSSFLPKILDFDFADFKTEYNDRQLKAFTAFEPIKQGVLWQQKALRNFMNMQFAFASLIEADKRDAGDNEVYLIQERLVSCNTNLQERLKSKFTAIDTSTNPSELNKVRTAIRKEAEKNVGIALKSGNRIFSLPAPTGAGKTFTLLAVAKKILAHDSNLGISYILPFLSITDQVEDILKELGIECLPISSKSENELLDKTQLEYELNPTTENLNNLLKQSFAENTFDHPFILTTFVQFFETLVSNKNSTLLKLPNFSNRIFLIDEIQALPPRLYIFFAAYLEAFCKEHNAYVVFSTGTMPKFNFPDKTYSDERKLKDPKELFVSYKENCIADIVDPSSYFTKDVFNRYRIDWISQDDINYQDLIAHVKEQNQSCLVILNTIADTKYVYKELKNQFQYIILLNTHFVVQDRKDKIEKIKKLLKEKEQVIVISTQLIEAGVDVDFPVVYRDLCPLPSLIQSAGRCNRNKLIEYGQVYLFSLKDENGKKSSEMIYRKEAKDFIQFCKSEIKDGTYEKDLFIIQGHFFEKIKNELTIGDFVWDIDRFGNEKKENFIECINYGSFEKVGRFRLIVESQFGETYQYFVPENEDDKRYEELLRLSSSKNDYKALKERLALKISIDSALKQISNRLLTVRIKQGQTPPLFSNEDQLFGIRVLSELTQYSKEEGIELGIENCFL